MPSEMPSLTALRGIAALIVLLFHANLILHPELHALAGPACPVVPARGIERGYLAVDFFFVLSGFIMLHVYGPAFSGPGPLKAWPFFRARIARIFPVHLATTALLVPFYASDPSHSAVGLIATVALVHAPWFWVLSWNPAAWSISAEWHAYLLFPFLARQIIGGSSTGAALRIGAYAAITVICVMGLVGCGEIATSPLVLGRALPEFVMGAVTYRVFIGGIGRELLARDTVTFAIVATMTLLSDSAANDVFLVLLLPLLLLSCAYNEGTVRRVLTSSPCVYLGRISYSIYLGQGVVMTSMLAFGAEDALPQPLLRAAAFIVLSIAGAHVMSKRLEYPARDLVRKALGGIAAASGISARAPG